MTQRQSTRQSSRTSGRVARASEAKISARGEGKKGQSMRKAGGTGGGKELMIGGIVIVVLCVAVGIMYVQKNTEIRDATEAKRLANKATEDNIDRAKTAFRDAERAGMAFVTSKNEKATDEELFGSLKGNDTVYNVVFNRNYTDKRRSNQTEQRPMFKERMTPLGIGTSLGTPDGIQINKGTADNGSTEIVIARKNYMADKDDKTNSGGEILVIVKAVKAK
ncbi:MAG: hypothetical protein HY291_14515 [Planctomycetes bacterium]|nr:hypothetical protein [Planctomycetota bacterium]